MGKQQRKQRKRQKKKSPKPKVMGQWRSMLNGDKTATMLSLKNVSWEKVTHCNSYFLLLIAFSLFKLRNDSISTLGIQCANHIQQLDLAGGGVRTSGGFRLIFLEYATVALRAEAEAHLLLRRGMEVLLGTAESLHYVIS